MPELRSPGAAILLESVSCGAGSFAGRQRKKKSLNVSGAFVRSVLLAMILSAFATPAFAHTGAGMAGGFISGFFHPVLGWDHVAAMVAVGIWGAFLRAPAMWVLPVVFPLVMTLGGVASVLGMPLPGVEIGIALSSILIGLLIAFAVRAPLWFAALIVGAFAIFHGHAHGTELPAAANAATFAGGFVLATGLLHLAGIAIGLLVGRPGGALAVRTVGGLIALLGFAFLFGFA